jgi:hypothetical protein
MRPLEILLSVANLLAFFDRHLKSQPATRFDGPTKQYPEVHFETRRP